MPSKVALAMSILLTSNQYSEEGIKLSENLVRYTPFLVCDCYSDCYTTLNTLANIEEMRQDLPFCVLNLIYIVILDILNK